MCSRKYIERHFRHLETAGYDLVIFSDNVFRCDPARFSIDRDRDAVFVRSADIYHVSLHIAEIAHINIGGKISPCKMAEVDRTVRVGQG